MDESWRIRMRWLLLTEEKLPSARMHRFGRWLRRISGRGSQTATLWTWRTSTLLAIEYAFLTLILRATYKSDSQPKTEGAGGFEKRNHRTLLHSMSRKLFKYLPDVNRREGLVLPRSDLGNGDLGAKTVRFMSDAWLEPSVWLFVGTLVCSMVSVFGDSAYL